MDVQIPYRLHAQVPKEGDIWTVQGRPAGDNPDALQIQGHRDSGRPHDAGSRTSAAEYPSEVQCIISDGISQREERAYDVRQAREPEIQVREQALLVRRVLREHGRAQ